MAAQEAITFDPKSQQLTCSGAWDLNTFEFLQQKLAEISLPDTGEVLIDGAAITKMDTAGALLIMQLLKKLKNRHITSNLINFSESHQKLLSFIQKEIAAEKKLPKVKIPFWLYRLGKLATFQLIEVTTFFSFVGELALDWLRVLRVPIHIRWRQIASVIETAGYNALPIIAVLSFMVGVILTYQIGLQLRNYGANIYIVNFLGLAVLREFGPLVTAIMATGRTGSAFTAQLGMMQLNEEIDALKTMGITPGELLILPRIIGLVIVLPLLTMWADIFNIIGGMMMAKNMLGISWYAFLQRFQHVVELRSLLIGLGKAPIFALIIAGISCFNGMQVKMSADSIGKQTTRSVVWSIFFIMMADAVFSVVFDKFKL